MSVQWNQYLIYGAKLDYEKYSGAWYEKLEKYCDDAFNDEINPEGLHCLYDGMNGCYVVVGICIKKSKLYSPLKDISFGDLKEIDGVLFEDIKFIAKELVKSRLGIDEPMDMHLITHYR